MTETIKNIKIPSKQSNDIIGEYKDNNLTIIPLLDLIL